MITVQPRQGVYFRSSTLALRELRRFNESLVNSAYLTYHGDMIATVRGEVVLPEVVL